MIRGTTPKHTFTLPFDTSELEDVRIIYAQDDEVLFKKETADCTLDANVISVTLTEEETLQFNHEKLAQIQLRVQMKGGDILSTDVMVSYVGKCLDTEVLT